MPKPPKLPKNVKVVMDLTFYSKCSLWYDNFAVNLPMIRGGRDVSELPRFDGEPVVLVGAGPSIWKFNHLELLGKWRKPIICVDKMLIPLLKRGIKPNIVASVDGDPSIKSFYDDPAVDEVEGVKAVFSVTVHPEVVKRCPFEKYWFINIFDEPTEPRSLTAAFHFMSGRKSMLVAGGTVGFFIVNLAYFLGCNPIILIGYDYSYDDLDITKTAYYKAYLAKCNGDKEAVKRYFSVRQNPKFKNFYLIDLMWQVYRDIFEFYVKRMPVKIINATEAGSLHSIRNVEQRRFKQVLEQYG
mgnify:CR=1 FL=1